MDHTLNVGVYTKKACINNTSHKKMRNAYCTHFVHILYAKSYGRGTLFQYLLFLKKKKKILPNNPTQKKLRHF